MKQIRGRHEFHKMIIGTPEQLDSSLLDSGDPDYVLIVDLAHLFPAVDNRQLRQTLFQRNWL